MPVKSSTSSSPNAETRSRRELAKALLLPGKLFRPLCVSASRQVVWARPRSILFNSAASECLLYRRRPGAYAYGPGGGLMTTAVDWAGLMKELGPDFASRCAEHDQQDSFVADNYAALKSRGAYAAGVPAELGGGGATHAELCAMIRELAHHCSTTALAISMHTHLIATLSYAWRAGNKS